MKNKNKKIDYSKARRAYLKKIKKDKIWVLFWQIAIFAIILGLWELLAQTGAIDPFFFSSPSRIAVTITGLAKTGNLCPSCLTSLIADV